MTTTLTYRLLAMLLATLSLACDTVCATVGYAGDSLLYGAVQSVVRADVWGPQGRAPYVLAANPGYGLRHNYDYLCSRVRSAREYDALVVMLGTNDALYLSDAPEPPLDTYADLVRGFAGECLPEGRALVWVAVDTSLAPARLPVGDTGVEIVVNPVHTHGVWASTHEGLAHRPRTRVVDTADVLADCPECYTPDGIHWSATGNDRVVSAVARALDELGVGAVPTPGGAS